MSDEKTAVVILAAGLGTRMKSSRPKVLHSLAGRPMIRHLLASIEALDPDLICAVVGEEMAAVQDAVAPHLTVIQRQRKGTGHAVMATREVLEGFQGDILIVYGDAPLLSTGTLRRMLEMRRSGFSPAVVLLGFCPADPGDYGRLVVDGGGRLQRIVEAKDAAPEELAIGLCNAGTMAVDGSRLFGLLDQIDDRNAKGEYYLTDIVAVARRQDGECAVVEGDESELVGINTRADLARAEAFVQDGLRAKAMAEGATLIDPGTVFFSFDTRLGRDVTVEPHVFFAPGVTVGDGVHIRGFCHLEQTTIGDGALIGPFARLRPGAAIASEAHIGNFVEIKNATVEQGAKVNHLTYIGDARIGSRANVGAGTITCNYDGFFKSFTDIGAGAFIGSNTSLVAPVTIGDGAIIGAGSVIARDVAADALALTRGPHAEKADWAKSFRHRRGQEKAARAKQSGKT
jgi:bifunctional UDP-N-acetylglucosamine pyrophosphorylase/glucosamine-1-phosphate N-acetyltransferase